MFGRIGLPELLLIFLILALVFGANRLPDVARGMGKAIRGFKDATNEPAKDVTKSDHDGQPRA
jgi:sec-independent protein translocase protein TatA